MLSGFARYIPAPGRSGWIGIVRGRYLAIVPSGTSAVTVQELWQRCAESDTPIEQIVGAIPLAGVAAVESFVIAAFPQQAPTGEGASGPPDCTISAVVRGDACLDVYSIGGARRFSAGGVTPWLLSDFRSVTSVVAGGQEHPAAAFSDTERGSLPIESAVVIAHQLTWTLNPAESPGAELEDETVVRLRVAGAVQTPDDTILLQRRFNTHSVESHSAEPTTPVKASAPSPVATSISVAAKISAPAPGREAAGSRSPVPERLPDPPPAPFWFRIGDQPSQPLRTPVLIGREPAAVAPIAGVAARLIAVPSPRSEVSATHLRLAQEGRAIVVTDLRSTNGTVVIPPGRRPVRLRSGTSVVVVVGTRVDIGDGNIIEILPDKDSSDRPIE